MTTIDTDTAQAERWARREPLLHLLLRAARGALTAAEGPLLRAAVETELADAEHAHARRADVLHIVAAWCTEANEIGGLDAGDLAGRLRAAGHELPDTEPSKRPEVSPS